MPFSKLLKKCLCERCGHTWKVKPDKITGAIIEPDRCAGCKQTNWNKPRKYQTKKTFLAITRRNAPTGRHAAKLKIQPELFDRFDAND